MAKLKVVVDSLDELDEGLREIYVESDDGKHYLQLEGVDDHPDVKGMKVTLDEVKAGRKQAKDALKAAEKERDALTLKVSELNVKVDEKDENSKNVEEKLATLKTELAGVYEKDTKEKDEKIAALTQELDDSTVGVEIKTALVEADIESKNAQLLELYMRPKAKRQEGKVVVMGDNNIPLTGKGGADMTVEEYVNGPLKDMFPQAYPSANPSGTGSPGNADTSTTTLSSGQIRRSDWVALTPLQQAEKSLDENGQPKKGFKIVDD